MKIIEDAILDKALIESSFENVNEEILKNSLLENYFKKYLLLTYYPEKFEKYELLDLYYNRYYWFLKFLVNYKKIYNYDAGLEQQEFKILEDGSKYSNIDWSVMEKISNEIKNLY